MAAKNNSKAYQAWRHMIERCHVETHPAFKNYGARGIVVCPEWLSFDKFLSDMGKPSPGLTLERRDNAAGYFPENCYWATRKDQARNTRQTIFVEWRGQKIPLAQLCETYRVSRQMVRKRIGKGWPIAEAVSFPARRGASYKYRFTDSPTTPTH